MRALGRRAPLLGAAVALAGALLLVLLWPPTFGFAFWLGFWALWAGLLLLLGASALRLLGAAPLWRKLAGGVLAAMGIALAGGIGMASVRYVQMGASLETYETPERHDEASARTNRLVYMRLRTTAADPGPPIVYLAGGPGGPGTLSALTARLPLFLAMRELGDVIALDQRGTMPWNDPWLICPGTWDYPLDRPLLEEPALEIMRAAVRACLEWAVDYGIDPAAYTTAESADDLEDLRRHLGSETLTLWGTSYGSHLALAYLRRYPESVHRVVLHGIEGPDHTLKLPSNVQAALEQEGLTREVRDALAGLEAQPQTVELDGDRVTVGAFDLQRYSAELLTAASSRRRLHEVAEEIGAGDLTSLARFARSQRGGQRFQLMAILMDCASGASPERLERIRAEARDALLGDAINFPFPHLCQAVPVPDLGPEFRAPVRSDVPVLFISGTRDGRTPVSNAEEVLAGFPNGTHLVVEGAGHGNELFLSSPRILDTMRAFMSRELAPGGRIDISAEP